MGLTSTLYTGLSGLDVNQTRLNVTGNNIANVNTVAFKSSRANFKSQFYVTDIAGAPASGEFGGVNPSQRGLGAVVAAIEKDLTTGTIEPTGKGTDLAMDGEGYFIVQGSSQSFTRDGSFKLNSSNELVTTGGQFVQGFGVDENSNVIAGQLQKLTIPLGTLTDATATENATLEGNLNANGDVSGGTSVLNSAPLVAVSGGALAVPPEDTLLTDLAAPATSATPAFAVGQTLVLNGKKGGRNVGAAELEVTSTTTLGDLASFFEKDLGIDTTVPAPVGAANPGVSVDVAGAFVSLTVVGNGGTENALTIPGSGFVNSGGSSPMLFAEGVTAGGIESNPSGESIYTSFVAYDSLGTPINVNITATLENKDDTGNTWRFIVSSPSDTDKLDTSIAGGNGIAVGTGTLKFDNEGKLLSTSGNQITINRKDTGATEPLSFLMDFGQLTSLTSQDSDLVATKQDGSPIGTLSSYSIGADGRIVGSFTNGLTKALGQVAVATFKNPQGLVDKGGNLMAVGPSSGVAIITGPLELGAGAIRSGALELSNVDLSKEFVNLIISSTGFSAASKVITTSDQLIQQLLASTR